MQVYSSRSDRPDTQDELAYAAKYRGIGRQRAARSRSWAALVLNAAI